MMGGEDGHQEQKIEPIEFMIGRTFWWENGSEVGSGIVDWRRKMKTKREDHAS